MKLPEAKIETAAANGDVRYYLNGIYVDTEAECLVATNGCILARVPCAFENGEVSGIVPIELVKAARVGGSRAIGEINQRTNDNGVTEYWTMKWDAKRKRHGEVADLAIDGKFPDYKKVIPDKPAGPPTLAINAQLLADLQTALSTGIGVSLWVTGLSDPIYVEAFDAEKTGACGVLMPARGPNSDK